MRRIFDAFWSDQHGGITVLSLFLFLAMAMIMGLAVDYKNTVRNQSQLQTAADAAALAAILDLPDVDAATASGIDFARQNLSSGDDLQAVDANSFEYGNWDKSTRSFTVNAVSPDAVRVTLQRTSATGNPVNTFMLWLAGIESYDVTANAVSYGDSSGGCETGGFFSRNDIISGSNNNYIEGFCLYGQQRVKIGSDNFFEDGVSVGMENDRNLEQSQNNTGIQDALEEYSYDLVIPPIILPLYDDLRQEGNNYPAFLTSANIVKQKEISSSDDLDENTIYIIEEVADLGDDKNIRNIAVIAGKEIKIGGKTNTENVVLITQDKLLVGSNNVFGPDDYCASGSFNTYMFARGNIEFGSDNHLRGVQMGSEEEIKLGSQIIGVEGVHAEAIGNFDYGSANTYGGCPQKLESAYVNPDINSSGEVSFATIAIVQ